MTYDANEYLAKSGYSVEGFWAYKARKNGYTEQPKKSAHEWLEGKKDCLHCMHDGDCRKQKFGYTNNANRYMVNDLGNEANYDENGLYNARYEPVGYQSCCRWSGEMTDALLAESKKMIEKGELTE